MINEGSLILKRFIDETYPEQKRQAVILREAFHSEEHLYSGDSLEDYPANSTISLTFSTPVRSLQVINRDATGMGGFITVVYNGINRRLYSGDNFPIQAGQTLINSVSIVGVVGMDVSWVASI